MRPSKCGVCRGGQESLSLGNDWSKLVDPRDAGLDGVAGMLEDARVRRRTQWVFVNNHFEDRAPLTVERLQERLS